MSSNAGYVLKAVFELDDAVVLTSICLLYAMLNGGEGCYNEIVRRAQRCRRTDLEQGL